MTAFGKTKIGILSAALLVGAAAMPTFGQQAAPGGGGGGNGNGGGGGGGGGGGRANYMQRMADQLKQELGMSDEEFTAIQPKIMSVMELQRASGGGGGRGGRGGPGGGGPGGGGPGGGPGGGGAPTPNDPAAAAVQTKRQDLQAALDNKDTSADDIKTKLAAYRESKAAAKTALAKAQDDLKGALTQRQEAVLVMRGMLD